MEPIVWAILLMVLGLALVVLEVFIPSGGILGFLAVCSVITSVCMAFYYRDAGTGFAFVLVAVVGFPSAVALALKWWPETPLGRRMLGKVPDEDDVLPAEDLRRKLAGLMHKVGVAKSDMFPGGAISIAGTTYEAVSEGMPIDKGQPIEVVDVQNNRLVVRPSDQQPTSPDPDDVLSQPIDTVGLDPFEDPLA